MGVSQYGQMTARKLYVRWARKRIDHGTQLQF
jgi:hypothetical protein